MSVKHKKFIHLILMVKKNKKKQLKLVIMGRVYKLLLNTIEALLQRIQLYCTEQKRVVKTFFSTALWFLHC